MSQPPKYKTVAAGMIGNLLEWYDFAIYGYFAAAIGPTSSRTRIRSPNFFLRSACSPSVI